MLYLCRWDRNGFDEGLLQETGLLANFFECRQRPIHFFFRQRCADLHADARRTFRNDREAEARYENALLQQRSLMAIANAVSPTMIGTIALSLGCGL